MSEYKFEAVDDTNPSCLEQYVPDPVVFSKFSFHNMEGHALPYLDSVLDQLVCEYIQICAGKEKAQIGNGLDMTF